MLKKVFNISILSLFFASACTQQPAQIVMKGQDSYTGGKKSAYSNNSSNSSYDSGSHYRGAPVSESTEQNASVSSIGISDLSPPSENAKPEVKQQLKAVTLSAPALKVDKTPADDKNKDGEKTTLNPWTNKPRSDNVPQSIDSKAKEDLKLAISEEIVEAEKTEDAAKTEAKPVAEKVKSPAGFKWPVAGKKIISSFGSKGEGKANDGINIAASNGDSVWAAADGQVVYVSNELKGYGNMVFIKHAGGKTSSYAHLGKITVDKYDRVKQGDVIGYVGSTGDVKTPQLFFSLHKGKLAIDPQKYVSSDVAGM